MDIGMLWYDDTKRTLDEKIARAVEHYKTKYGAVPTVCFVNPELLPKASGVELAGVQLRAARTVLMNHFWLGVGDAVVKNGNGNGGARGKSGNGPRRKHKV